MVRKNLRIFMLIGLLLSSVGAATSEPLRIVATVPDLGELSRAVGGDKVQVKVLAKPTEDPHFVDPKPSFVKALNQADLLYTIGTGHGNRLGPRPSQECEEPGSPAG